MKINFKEMKNCIKINKLNNEIIDKKLKVQLSILLLSILQLRHFRYQ